jgi:hypothetical protein
MIEALIVGLVVFTLGVGIALIRKVYRLSGIVENGLVDAVKRIDRRIDKLYHHFLGEK